MMQTNDITRDLVALKRANELTTVRHPYQSDGYIARPDLATEWRDCLVEHLIDARESLRLLRIAKKVSAMVSTALKSPVPPLHEKEMDAHIAHLEELLGSSGSSTPPQE